MVPGVASNPVWRIAVLALLVPAPTSSAASSNDHRALVVRQLPGPPRCRRHRAPMTTTSQRRRARSSQRHRRSGGGEPRGEAVLGLVGAEHAGSTVVTGVHVPTASASVAAPPAPRRAKAATPSAVACGDGYTSTGSCSRSAWICSSVRERVRPPSTRSRVSGAPRSARCRPGEEGHRRRDALRSRLAPVRPGPSPGSGR